MATTLVTMVVGDGVKTIEWAGALPLVVGY